MGDKGAVLFGGGTSLVIAISIHSFSFVLLLSRISGVGTGDDDIEKNDAKSLSIDREDVMPLLQ